MLLEAWTHPCPSSSWMATWTSKLGPLHCLKRISSCTWEQWMSWRISSCTCEQRMSWPAYWTPTRTDLIARKSVGPAMPCISSWIFLSRTILLRATPRQIPCSKEETGTSCKLGIPSEWSKRFSAWLTVLCKAMHEGGKLSPPDTNWSCRIPHARSSQTIWTGLDILS